MREATVHIIAVSQAGIAGIIPAAIIRTNEEGVVVEILVHQKMLDGAAGLQLIMREAGWAVSMQGGGG